MRKDSMPGVFRIDSISVANHFDRFLWGTIGLYDTKFHNQIHRRLTVGTELKGSTFEKVKAVES